MRRSASQYRLVQWGCVGGFGGLFCGEITHVQELDALCDGCAVLLVWDAGECADLTQLALAAGRMWANPSPDVSSWANSWKKVGTGCLQSRRMHSLQAVQDDLLRGHERVEPQDASWESHALAAGLRPSLISCIWREQGKLLKGQAPASALLPSMCAALPAGSWASRRCQPSWPAWTCPSPTSPIAA